MNQLNQQFTIYDDAIIENDKKFTLKYIIITNIISFVIGIGFHSLLINH
jgi:hypothetical protein